MAASLSTVSFLEKTFLPAAGFFLKAGAAAGHAGSIMFGINNMYQLWSLGSRFECVHV